MEIIFDDRQTYKKIDEDILDKVERVMLAVLDYEDYDDNYEVSLSFVDNEEIRNLNRDFRIIAWSSSINLAITDTNSSLLNMSIPLKGSSIMIYFIS